MVVVDGASAVLPYDFQLVAALAASGRAVRFCGSRTAYNGELLESMRALPGVQVDAANVSGTVAARGKGVLAYVALLWRAMRAGRRGALVNLQFSLWAALEAAMLWPVRERLIFTVHNAAPHGHGEGVHLPTERLARLAARLVFVSAATRDDFLRRYGERFRAKSALLPHGLLPVIPGLPPEPPVLAEPVRELVFWSNVKAYKGVELFEALAASEEVARRGLALRVVGRWDGLDDLRQRLRAAGVDVVDRYLPADELLAMFARRPVFLLPYRRASQSGALYTLLQHGCAFLCTDTGDLGDFLRRYGLEGLILREPSAGAVLASLDWLAAHREQVLDGLRRAQAELAWEHLLQAHPQAYGPLQAR